MRSVRASLHYTLRSENPNVCQQRVDLLKVNVKWELPEHLERIQAAKILMRVSDVEE